MQALVLAAGYGRRLYPLTKEYPKPLLIIKDRPIIDYIIYKLENIKEIKKIWIVTNNKFFSYFLRWKKERSFKKSIGLINDLSSDYKNRLGALKDIDFVIKHKKIKEDLIIVGGDNLFEEGLEGFVSFIKKKRKYFIVGLYRIKDIKQASRYGVAKLNSKKEIIDFEEKPKVPVSNLVGMCLYYFPKDKFFLLDEYLKKQNNSSDATGNFIVWLHKKEKIYAYIFKGFWYDIGEHMFLREAEKKLSKIRR